jgi:mRNA interferase RelE/StbE
MYVVDLTDYAEDDLSRLERVTEQQVINRLNWLAENAEAIHHQALTGRWRGFYRLRVGDYRALYTLDHGRRRIVVELVGHRSEVYRPN